MKILKTNADASKKIALAIHKLLPEKTENPIFDAAKYAIMTKTDLIPIETKRKLQLLYGKYWG